MNSPNHIIIIQLLFAELMSFGAKVNLQNDNLYDKLPKALYNPTYLYAHGGTKYLRATSFLSFHKVALISGFQPENASFDLAGRFGWKLD